MDVAGDMASGRKIDEKVNVFHIFNHNYDIGGRGGEYL